jgi:hypothetical protein
VSGVYTALDPSLRDYAEEAKSYFSVNWGIPKGKFAVETAIDRIVPYKPTLHALAVDQHILCIDVCQSYFTDVLNAFVLDCKNVGLPVKLFVVVPSPGKFDSEDLRRATDNGVGVLQLQLGTAPVCVRNALSLSLVGVSRPAVKEFPPRYRQAVNGALQTFLDGNPVDGCLDIYKQVEGLTRRLAKRAAKDLAWKNLSREPPPKLKWSNANWANIADTLYKRLDDGKLKCQIPLALLGRIVGATDHRNKKGHLPETKAQLMRRDASCRTHFESGAELLKDLIAATKSLSL